MNNDDILSLIQCCIVFRGLDFCVTKREQAQSTIGATKKGVRGPWAPPIRSKMGPIRSKMCPKMGPFGMWSFMKIPLVSLDQKGQNCFGPP